MRSPRPAHGWTVDEVRQFEERHPIGTKARLALALLLYLGVRRGDVVGFGHQHVKDGGCSCVPHKTRYRRLEPSQKANPEGSGRHHRAQPDWRPDLPGDGLGTPSRHRDFGGQLHDRWAEAGLPHCSAPGSARPARLELPRTAPPIASSWRSTTGRQRSRPTCTPRPLIASGWPAKRRNSSLCDQNANADVSHQSGPPEKSDDRSTG